MSQDSIDRNKRATNIWTARAMPIVLTAVVAYATYVLVALLCVNYLLVKHKATSAAISILVIYFILFVFMASAFLRVVYMTTIDPPYAPLGAGALRARSGKKSKRDEIAGDEYTSGDSAAIQNDPDSPGLELFYTKDVFTVEMDGKPKWCSECCIWKLDRQHHCSAVGRCIYKMDHYCPWVGGPVGETNFKFFIQFVSYTTLYCLHVLVVMATYIHRQHVNEGESINSQFIAVLALAAFFGLFTGTMTSTSVRLAIYNLTTVEDINKHRKIHRLAILKPSLQRLSEISIDAATTQTYSEITYPLAIPSSSGAIQNNMPIVKTIRHEHLSEPVPIQVARHLAGLPDVSLEPPISQVCEESTPNDSHVEPAAGQLAESNFLEHPSMPLTKPLPINAPSSTPISDQTIRDRQAVRTFAILETTRAGDNPWDLGSALLNVKTVMGERLIDWLLPLKRSPCCNHENTESHFQIGPCVDRIRASVSFIPPDEVRAERGKVPRIRFRKDDRLSTLKRRRARPSDEESARKTNETELRDFEPRNLHDA